MRYTKPLERVLLLKRYKRFLADVKRPSGEVFTIHTPNTGSMLGCSTPGSYIWIRDAANPKRKYRYSWELSEMNDGTLVGVNTGLVNSLVSEAIHEGVIEELDMYPEIRQEVKYGQEGSRIDLLLEGKGLPACYVEIKNVTALDDEKKAIFPDAVTARGLKHLRELQSVAMQGGRAVIFFCIQRNDPVAFRPAHEIDSAYANELKQAVENGVDAIAYKADVTPEGVRLCQQLKINLSV